MSDFAKTVRLGVYNRNSVFARIEYKNGRLSICGVEGPLASGNSRGGCGQIVWHLLPVWHRIKPAPGWSGATVQRFLKVWERWHLNDMRAGTPAQEAWLRDHGAQADRADHFTWATAALAAVGLNPDHGYRYGEEWLTEEVPAGVLDFLRALPDSDRVPAWV
jgi:hypothetical protein